MTHFWPPRRCLCLFGLSCYTSTLRRGAARNKRMGCHLPPWSILEWKHEKRKPYGPRFLTWFSTDNFSEDFHPCPQALVRRRKAHGNKIKSFDSFGAVKILVAELGYCAVYKENPAAVKERVAAAMTSMDQRGLMGCYSSCDEAASFFSHRRLPFSSAPHHGRKISVEETGCGHSGSADSFYDKSDGVVVLDSFALLCSSAPAGATTNNSTDESTILQPDCDDDGDSF